MITLYGKKNDDGTVDLFCDKEMKKRKLRWNSYGAPDYRFKYVTLNCFRYKLEWIRVDT